MSLAIEPRTCPTCWSTQCLAGKEYAPGQHYAHDWQSGPMRAAHLRWKDERTPPASLQEAIERGFIKPPESVTDTESVTRESVTDQPEPESVTASERACIECGKPLASTRPDARFCSAACRMKAHRRAEAPAA